MLQFSVTVSVNHAKKNLRSTVRDGQLTTKVIKSTDYTIGENIGRSATLLVEALLRIVWQTRWLIELGRKDGGSGILGPIQ